jgi:16S rRNA (cytosine967-C5)-methyltransferase
MTVPSHLGSRDKTPNIGTRMPRARLAPAPEVPGLAARRVAADIIDGVLRRKLPLDAQLNGKGAHPGLATLADRDRALTRRLIATVLRRLGTLRHMLGQCLDRGFPADAPRIETILLLGGAQILWLDVPDHAAVDLAVRLSQADRHAARYVGLVNAVLRRLTRDGRAMLADADETQLNTPAWLLARWTKAYGPARARDIAAANTHEPALDLTVKADADKWAARLHGRVLATGSVRTVAHGSISMLPGFSEGAWWVQDAAAALPARLFGDLYGCRAIDLCAAPGGKTAQLAHAGATVTAIDRSAPRLQRLADNLTRLGLSAQTIAGDVLQLDDQQIGGPFDAVLLDAPCSSTGTIRRHPDVPLLKSPADIETLASLQQRLLDRAVELTRPGGTLIYCVCSLEPEEGEEQVAALLARDARVTLQPIAAAEVAGYSEFLTSTGEMRTLPCHLPDADSRWSGLDGFYCARLSRSA